MLSRCALVYSRYPEVGRVKTRLIPSLSAEGAALIHQACLRATWSRWEHAVGELVLVGTPDGRQADFGDLLGCEDGLRFWTQGDGDLGKRLTRGFARAFEAGHETVVAVGTDSPTLPRSEMGRAFEMLAEHDLVLGPAEDGGYYLIGMRRFEPGVFRDVAWGGDAVASKTLDNAQQLGLSVGLLESWYDVDTPADVERLRRELMARTDLCPSEQDLLRSLNALPAKATDP